MPHQCDHWCICPEHGVLLLYSAAVQQHACRFEDCIYAHGMVICSDCWGTGATASEPCWDCRGEGWQVVS